MRALISVHDKTGLVPFGSRLAAAGWEIVSSGGTARSLEEAGVAVTRVSDVTGSPEILDGRVKTLHPAIHGGILARGPGDEAELAAVGAAPFDLVVCNLYPFRQTLASGADEADVVEMIDIGGPAMIRAAAKNHQRLAVVVDPARYDEVAMAIEAGGIDLELRRELAAEAFFQTAAYDAAIVEWLGGDRILPLRRVSGLRYGENPHQPAALFVEEGESPWWAEADQVQGKEMSFNNYADAEAAWRLCADLGPNSAVVVKHTVACGAAAAGSVAESFRLAWDGDSLAAFGGVVGINGEIDSPTAEEIAGRFVEVVVARSLGEGAAEALSRRAGMRVLLASAPMSSIDYRRISGGFLVQEPDTISSDDWEVVSKRSPTETEEEALRVAWTVAAHARSNAVVLVSGVAAVGVGSGDQSRVGAAERAVAKAGSRARNAVAASDAFFPFRDGIDTLAFAGVTAVVVPGGSRNDAEVVAAADEHGMALLFSPERHFRH
jgi:phosphoribosylaminoimidazolecarboxamide formyltransferase / IMP cyclohydrolase